MNKSEKEELYLEFKERLKTEEIGSSRRIKGPDKLKQVHFLDEAKNHFQNWQGKLYDLSDKKEDYNDWTNHNLCMISYGWDNVRHLICWSYGVCTVDKLPGDKQKEINELAIKIIDDLFNQYSKLWIEP